MHRYRTHTCAALRKSDVDSTVRLSGWVQSRPRPWRVAVHRSARPLRHDPGRRRSRFRQLSPGRNLARQNGLFASMATCKARSAETINPKLPTGEVEIFAREIEILSAAGELPLPVFGEPDYPEDVRLKYRFLDLRREPCTTTSSRRTKIVASMRRLHGGSRFHRIFDADPDCVLAGRRARLSRAEPHSSRTILCPAAGAAAVQAADDGGRLRPLFPDRALFPRRGSRAPTGCRANSTSSTSR